MSLVVIGANHNTAPLSMRERLSVSDVELADVLEGVMSYEGVNEAVILSTCNRVEYYLSANTERLGAKACVDLFAEKLGDSLDPSEFYLHRGNEAVEHAFRVAASLDSQVLGESQILGQMKRAYEAAAEAGACGKFLTELFKSAIRLGKRVRTETSIGCDSVSLSTTAVKAATRNVGSLSDASAVIVGAGEMACLTAEYLRSARCANVVFTSRSYDHALESARVFGFKAMPFERRYEAIEAADVVFAATSSPDPVILAQSVASVMTARRGRKLVLIDESVPRNIASDCGNVGGVVLYDQESLMSIIDDGLAKRMGSVSAVEGMVDEALEEFSSWMEEHLVQPTIKDIYLKGASTLGNELRHASNELAKARGEELTAKELGILAAYGNAMVKKLLHGPVTQLKKEAHRSDSYYYVDAMRYLFDLDENLSSMSRSCESGACLDGGYCPMQLDERIRPACQHSGGIS